ncbi:hypothetical protein H6G41_25710 [Tolypothrix sp. FACHB-123]|uniref:hypothetical protein n=1 Tax=Tolypothrix sp. FACHB-123 TaxID=2692868 RepID=UPI001685F13C|nr:hypothetical protein [Tolypothrix sp. FACHB-123]MBD2357968.1 hypothetical protein [Tolypothrix sp. FACHB-123]
MSIAILALRLHFGVDMLNQFTIVTKSKSINTCVLILPDGTLPLKYSYCIAIASSLVRNILFHVWEI